MLARFCMYATHLRFLLIVLTAALVVFVIPKRPFGVGMKWLLLLEILMILSLHYAYEYSYMRHCTRSGRHVKQMCRTADSGKVDFLRVDFRPLYFNVGKFNKVGSVSSLKLTHSKHYLIRHPIVWVKTASCDLSK